jgi:hypothetical protein
MLIKFYRSMNEQSLSRSGYGLQAFWVKNSTLLDCFAMLAKTGGFVTASEAWQSMELKDNYIASLRKIG